MPTLNITDLSPMSPYGSSELTAHQMQSIRGGAGEPMPVEPEGGIGSGPSLPWPGFPQLPGFVGTPRFFGRPVLPGYTPDRTPGPAESPIIF